MTKQTKHLILLLLWVLSACSGGGSTTSDVPFLEPLPNFNAPESEELAALVENTFVKNGVDITADPKSIDFNQTDTLELNDSTNVPFTITNRSGNTQTFKLQIYAVSTGFSLLNENKKNLGKWQEIEIPHGESKTFYAQFNAWSFGTQTSFVTLSATGSTGYIKIPLRATVNGAASFRIITSGYRCSDTQAPRVSSLDFLKVAHGQTGIQAIKLCNTGGEDITLYSAQLLKADKNLYSRAVENNAFEEFLWDVQDNINSALSLGITPEVTENFTEPVLTSYVGTQGDPVADYSISLDDSSRAIKDTLVAAGGMARLNVNFSPALDVQAPAGRLYEALPRNARLKLKTSLGTVDIPLLGATSGREPILKISYRPLGGELWTQVDLSSNGSAVSFDTVEVFKDWITDNYQVMEFKVENLGTGDEPLRFFPQTVAGYFEYDQVGGANPVFPLILPPGSAPQYFTLRYLPTPSRPTTRARWDMGQMYFEHTGGNGPRGKLTLIGERKAGYAVELKLGGSDLPHTPIGGTPTDKNLCVFKIDNGDNQVTTKNFTLNNNNKTLPLTASWNLSASSGYTATPASGSLTIPPDSAATFSIEFLANASVDDGQALSGSLEVETHYPAAVESAYSSQLSSKESRAFAINFEALASSTGECVLGGGKVIGSDTDGIVPSTLILDRVTMILTNLAEPTRNPPAFRTQLPMEVDHKNGRVRVSQKMEFIYDKEDPRFDPIHQIRSYAHQITHTNAGGCSTLPTNPYRLEYQKGSWTGPGFDCNATGSITISGANGSSTLDTDTACIPSNGGEEVTDADGVTWVVFYHEFVKFDTTACLPEYYGKIATFAYRKDSQTYSDLFEAASASPNESEAFYENLFGSFKYNSYITFIENGVKCGSRTRTAGETITDPDAIRECYSSLAEKEDSTRRDGFINECAYFGFTIDEGITPAAGNNNTDTWQGYGTYEPHVDDDGNVHATKYDLTIYNIHAQIFIPAAGDRFSFFSHPSKLLYTDIYFTLTTKRLADDECTDCDPFKRIAVKTRPQFSLPQIFLKDGKPNDIDNYWRNDGINSEFSNVIDDTDLPHGVNLGGYGKGAFRHCTNTALCDIVPAGWPVNFDENNIFTLVGTGSFNGKGSTAPGFAREDASGKGKPLYFTFHGCLVEGDADATMGCYPFRRDDAVMTNGTPVVDEYKRLGMLPDGYPEDSSECTSFTGTGHLDPLSPDFNPYLYMSCIDYKIFPQDRDRLINYYDSTKFKYKKDYYGTSTCGYGM